jgi:hypothetical protein
LRRHYNDFAERIVRFDDLAAVNMKISIIKKEDDEALIMLFDPYAPLTLSRDWHLSRLLLADKSCTDI